jgi:ribose 5-phosphate isomerase RpiB
MLTSGKGNERVDGQLRRERMGQLLTASFDEDPCIRYFLNGMSEKERAAYYPDYMKSLAKAAALNKGSFDVVGDFQAGAIW